MVLTPGGCGESDGWSRDLGLDGWNWEKVAPAYTRVEQDIQVRDVEALGVHAKCRCNRENNRVKLWIFPLPKLRADSVSNCIGRKREKAD